MAPPSRYYTRAGDRRKMTDDQYADYLETSSRLSRDKVLRVKQRADLSDEQKGRIIEKIIRNARRVARKRALYRRQNP